MTSTCVWCCGVLDEDWTTECRITWVWGQVCPVTTYCWSSLHWFLAPRQCRIAWGMWCQRELAAWFADWDKTARRPCPATNQHFSHTPSVVTSHNQGTFSLDETSGWCSLIRVSCLDDSKGIQLVKNCATYYPLELLFNNEWRKITEGEFG